MSQTENAVTSSSGTKRAYRKGNPLTLKQNVSRASSAQENEPYIKRLRVFMSC
ncbi:RepB family protein [Escherichia coli]|uniref:RepB family protein n=1 Tax=Escherichia coli TaxID=562 RepID=UPI003F4DF509